LRKTSGGTRPQRGILWGLWDIVGDCGDCGDCGGKVIEKAIACYLYYHYDNLKRSQIFLKFENEKYRISSVS